MILSLLALQTSRSLTDPGLQVSSIGPGTSLGLVRVRKERSSLCTVWLGTVSSTDVKLIRVFASTAELNVIDSDIMFVRGNVIACVINTGVYSRRLICYDLTSNRFLDVPGSIVLRTPTSLQRSVVGECWDTKASSQRYFFEVTNDGLSSVRTNGSYMGFWVLRDKIYFRYKIGRDLQMFATLPGESATDCVRRIQGGRT